MCLRKNMKNLSYCWKLPKNLKYFSGSFFNLTKVKSLDFTNVYKDNFKTLFPLDDDRVEY